MKIVNRTHLNDEIYQQFYTYHYHFDKQSTKIRNGDAWPAVCFAHDIFTVSYFDQLQEQLHWIEHNRQRRPQSVMEVGSGNGEVSYFFWKLGYPVVSVDCNPSAALFFSNTATRFFGPSDDRHTLCLGKTTAFLDHIPQDLDTLILVETIEHILADEWAEFFKSVQPVLARNQGRFIVTNTIWPLGGDQDPADEHIARIDDNFFDNLIAQGGRVLYRSFGNLCIQY
jgi:cyclopropane fatty-acyl-phospholipid synthase-like methyltransferase